jgi:hypothetical protein
MLSRGKKTHPGTLPQSQALENQAANVIPHGSERNRFGHCGSRPKERSAATQPVRGEPAGNVNPAASPAPVEQSTQAARGVTLVFVLASSGSPLMPCHPARARQFLKEGRARIHQLFPFTIRLVDRSGGNTQPILLKIDPGATTTGFALNRVAKDDTTNQTTLHLAELTHRGDDIRARNRKRAGYRRRRRSTNLRYRAPRFNNRRRAPGWLPFSLSSRVDNIRSWVQRYRKLAPITAIEVDRSGSIPNCYKTLRSAGSSTSKAPWPDTKSENTSSRNGGVNVSTAIRRVCRCRSNISFPEAAGYPTGPAT